MLDSVIRVNNKYYAETLLEKCKYKIENKKNYNFIKDELESDSESESD